MRRWMGILGSAVLSYSVEFRGAFMQLTRRKVLTFGLAVVGIVACVNPKSWSQLPGLKILTVKQVGTIKGISSDAIKLRTDTGADVNVMVQGSPRFLRIAPEQPDIKNASPIQFQDLQVGDRILVNGTLAEDGKSIVSSTIVAMKASDVQAKQQKERAEWQRGVGGLVGTVDAAAGTISISEAAPGGVNKITIKTTPDTVFHRYAPDSVKFDDAKPSLLNAIKPGDQLRARGTLNSDKREFAAAEIISGSFRNIAGTIASIDPAANTVYVTDIAIKKPVLVRIRPDSQIRMLPAEIAQRIAMQLRMAKAGGPAGTPEAGQPSRNPSGPAGALSGQRRGPGGSERPLDLQQILGRLPQSSIADLHKGDAVMIVSTEGVSSGDFTAITLLGGVDPILRSPGGGQTMMLSPWSLGGEGEGSQ